MLLTRWWLSPSNRSSAPSVPHRCKVTIYVSLLFHRLSRINIIFTSSSVVRSIKSKIGLLTRNSVSRLRSECSSSLPLIVYLEHACNECLQLVEEHLLLLCLRVYFTNWTYYCRSLSPQQNDSAPGTVISLIPLSILPLAMPSTTASQQFSINGEILTQIVTSTYIPHLPNKC